MKTRRFLNFFALMLLVFQLNAVENVSVERLAKKWKLEKYEYFIFSEEPSTKEQNDYIHLKKNMTFESVSEGKYERGRWRLDTANRRIHISKKNESGKLTLMIDKLSEDKLILIIDDPSDSDAKDLKIHFKI